MLIYRKLADHLGIKEYKPPTSTKYRDAQNHIIDFCQNYLFVEEFNIFKFNSKDFITIPENRITEIPEAANALAFGNNQSGIDPRTGIAEFGPYSPSPRNNVKFFFIAHESDKLLCNKLYQIFKEGCEIENKNLDDPLCKFKPLAEYIKQPFITDKNAHIFFNNPDNAISEIAILPHALELPKATIPARLHYLPHEARSTPATPFLLPAAHLRKIKPLVSLIYQNVNPPPPDSSLPQPYHRRTKSVFARFSPMKAIPRFL